MRSSDLALAALASLLSVAGLVAAQASDNAGRPNIVFILTDDQDLHMDSMANMPVLQDLLMNQGTMFSKHYAHVTLCCPSRATLWTGRHAHNTNITDVTNYVPGGAWKHIQQFGLYDKYLPVWMQAGGYNTYYSGKIYNGFNGNNYCMDDKCPAGWTEADFLLDPSTYRYYNSSYIHTQDGAWDAPRTITGYSTDIITNFTLKYLDDAHRAGKPFMAVAAPVAPHMAIGATYPNNNTRWPYPKPKDEYADLYQGLRVPRTANFNPSNRSGVATVWSLDQLDDANVGVLDNFHRIRQCCLRSVEDMIEAIVGKLDDLGILDNTYIIYSTDNGYHLGHHRLQGGKMQCFEEDINVPLIIRGPNVAKGVNTSLVTGHVDLAPTILGMAGVDIDPAWALDGQAITFPLESQDDFTRNFDERGETTHVEFWGPLRQEGMFNQIAVDYDKNLQTYKALRMQNANYSLLYSVWCQDGAHELYDMTWDQYQMTNLHPDAPAEKSTPNAYKKGMSRLYGRPTDRVIERLDAVVLVLKSCVGDECRNPWKQLHPDGSVGNLLDALDKRYDAFYANSYSNAKVGWKVCYTGYSPDRSATLYSLGNEEPSWLNATVKDLVQSGAHVVVPSVSATWACFFAWLCLIAFLGF